MSFDELSIDSLEERVSAFKDELASLFLRNFDSYRVNGCGCVVEFLLPDGSKIRRDITMFEPVGDSLRGEGDGV